MKFRFKSDQVESLVNVSRAAPSREFVPASRVAMLAEVSIKTINFGLAERSRGRTNWGFSITRIRIPITTARNASGPPPRRSRRQRQKAAASSANPMAAIQRSLQGGSSSQFIAPPPRQEFVGGSLGRRAVALGAPPAWASPEGDSSVSSARSPAAIPAIAGQSSRAFTAASKSPSSREMVNPATDALFNFSNGIGRVSLSRASTFTASSSTKTPPCLTS